MERPSEVRWRLRVMIAATIAGFLPAAGPAGVFPGATWQSRSPSEVGMDSARLDEFRNYLGGRGCVVRYGYMVYTWGNQSTRQDIASACKPIFTHFLFRAVEEGRLGSIDDPVASWEPCLNSLNASLGYKDRGITFRHMANQVSCYGVREAPGTAFDYNDWQMALFFDTLMLRVYGCPEWSAIDSQVFRPKLTALLQCQDSPTCMAFGVSDRPGRVAISVRDFARFGLLYLNRGNWNGTPLISEANALRAVRSPLPGSFPRTTAQAAEMCPGQRTLGSQTVPDDQTDHYGSYSFAWWTNGVDRNGQRRWPDAPTDAYGAFGHTNGKRAVVVIPSLDLVASWNDTTLDSRPGNPQNEALRLLAAAVLPGPASGQITVDAEHPAWFRYEGGGPFYMCGPGDPEGFLYRGTRNADGTRNGDQMALIQKLAGTGANCIYMQAVRSHGGDGDATQNPFINGNANNPLDEDILQQWETWFTAMDDLGITIYFIFYDDSASPFGRDLVGGQLDAREASFIDTIVRRFKHHKHLIWCVAEEYAEALSPARAAKIAERIRQQDDRLHPVAVHQNHGTAFDFKGNPNIHQFAVQYNVSTAEQLHAGTVAAWNDVGGRVNVNLAEFSNAGTGDVLRRKIWAIAFGGGYSMILGMDIASTPAADLEACGRLVRFMEATRFHETAPRDDLRRGHTDYVLADPGNVYLAWADDGDSLGLALVAGSYRIRWYDPLNGNWADEGCQTLPAGDRAFRKPAGMGGEVALVLESCGPALPPGKATEPDPADGAVNVPVDVTLSWTPGADAAWHEVYWGTVDPPPLVSTQAEAAFVPGPLAFHTTYYWCIHEVNAGGTTPGDVWSFRTGGPPAKAEGPAPSHGAVGVAVDADLSWNAAAFAASYDVYFGDAHPPPFRGNQTGTAFDPGTLRRGLTYFWRVDTLNVFGVTEGDTWTFTTVSAGDYDADGDVDLNDFAIFQLCFNGPGRPWAQAGCEAADSEPDGDVDLNDFAVFQSCFNGPGRPPGCPTGF